MKPRSTAVSTMPIAVPDLDSIRIGSGAALALAIHLAWGSSEREEIK